MAKVSLIFAGSLILCVVCIYFPWLWWQRRKLHSILMYAITRARRLADDREEQGFNPEETERLFYEMCWRAYSKGKLSEFVIPTSERERERLLAWLRHANETAIEGGERPW